MSEFECPVVRIERVEDHPNADRLSLVYFRDYATISAKLEDGSHRYNVGDLVVYCGPASIIPEYLLRQGFWDEAKGKGILSGSNGDRVKEVKLRGVLSEGIMFPCSKYNEFYPKTTAWFIQNGAGEFKMVEPGMNVADFLGIKKYEPEIPAGFAGDVVNIGAHNTLRFDIENIKRHTKTFAKDQIYTIDMTEKEFEYYSNYIEVISINS